ncbi:hypothetical protein HMPREF9997_02793 [Corynebacterium durum F0235]|uniref:Uncharacterized protein n=1 Tax=Corynebacterium durum F0235 TaxID=1035195 RepID=L1M8C8_9CORY|nr:hypothetical protein HMPREF9997_02793 [Corynebacterium durum F0235]
MLSDAVYTRTSDKPMHISSIVPSIEKYFHYENARIISSHAFP